MAEIIGAVSNAAGRHRNTLGDTTYLQAGHALLDESCRQFNATSTGL